MRISDWSSDVCSSDLGDQADDAAPPLWQQVDHSVDADMEADLDTVGDPHQHQPAEHVGGRLERPAPAGIEDVTQHHRSEEHTSELQSLMRKSYAVFCLKKKNTHIKTRASRDSITNTSTMR